MFSRRVVYIELFTSILLSSSISKEINSKGKVKCSSEGRCKCRPEGKFYKAFCSELALQEIPQFSENVNWIDLSKNKIYLIERIPQNIVVLNLTANCIESLQGHPFDGLTKLKILKLDYNNGINYTEHNFYQGIFESLKSLEELDIKNSPASIEKWEFPSVAISELASLKVLKINGLPDMTFPTFFRTLKKLQYLDISGRTGSFCSLRHVSNTFFENLPGLRHIDISYCHIRYIEKGVFNKHSNLSFLDISNNREMGFTVLQNVTDSFNMTNITTFKFDSITCTTGVGTMLSHCHLQNLYNTSITEFSSSFNRLEQFQQGVLRSLPKSIKTLTLKLNRLTPGKYLYEFSQLSGLEVLDISQQFGGLTYPTAWADPCKENVDFSLENGCTGTILYSQKFETLLYNMDRLNYMKHDSLIESKPYITFFLPPKMNEVLMHSSHLYGKVRMFGIHAENLKKIHLYDNGLLDWEGSVLGTENITYLDISSNYCHRVTSYFFSHLHSLITLNLSNNILGLSFADDNEGNIFQSQGKLEILNISNNHIEYLPFKFFKHTVQMRSLIIQNNKLSDFHLQLNQMRNLKFLGLANNRISSLSHASMESFERLLDERQNSVTIDISGNVFTCVCQSLKFLKWIALHKHTFKNLANYKCVESDVPFQFSKIDDSIEKLTKYCLSYLSIYLPTTIALTLIICILVGVGVYKNKWTLRYIIYKTKKKFRNGGNLIDNIQSTFHYQYDAYISYCGSDRTFVLSEMYPRLENCCGLKLLIRDKVFLPGESKSTCIMEGLQESCKAVCVVSKRYLSSKWRDFELNMAKVEGIKDRGSIRFVILILMPDVYNGIFPSKVVDLLKQDCFLEYPENERDYGEFWENLIRRISQNIYDS
ncbi:toll-like receptor 4 [Saccostrea echinata]|uniref:toll-like receptor 4 n=1 Tax=Saccostrea echinata TaxID=191078 RepID=UPI002A8215BE|nr:toll-like receptor 4 [Saccostrea echinata]